SVRTVVPLVRDDAVLPRGTAGQEGGVPGGGPGEGVGVMAVLEPGAIGLQSAETVLDVVFLPARQVVGAHLVEDNEDGQSRAFDLRRFFTGLRGETEQNQKGGKTG